ncbi:MAG TPA: RNA polymerase sigma factor [Steroidobacteraceae bacterium]|nr:RNA polymerase sigma factor [Steroidobacteraceae bacterium]
MNALAASPRAYSMSFAHGDGHDMPDALRARNAAFDRFFIAVERKAFRIARLALQNDDDALDAVQDSMLQLVRAYASRPQAEWKPLFYRILANRTRDLQRRRSTRGRLFAWWPTGGETDDGDDPASAAPSPEPGPERSLELGQTMALLDQFIGQLSHKQQQAFLLRNFEDLDVAQAARAMGCSEGSVKTHYSRAVHRLRARLMEAES